MVNNNDTITLPRNVVEQALEALTNCTSEYGHRCNRCDSEVDPDGNIASALRAALDQSNHQSVHESELMMNDASYRRKFEQPQANRRNTMTREDIIRMAHETKQPTETCWLAYEVEFLERFATLVAATEREECAKLCEELTGTVSMFASSRDARTHNAAVTECVAAIRART